MSKYSTKLHHALPTAGQKHNCYCGPAALAAITGINTGEAAKLLREIANKPWIKGTTNNNMLDALACYGFDVTDSYTIYPMKRMTLKRWLNERYDGRTALVEAWNHWWAFSGECFVDAFFRLPTPLAKVHKPKAMVCNVYYFE